MTTTVHTVDRVLHVARQQVGYHEGRSGTHWNNHEKYAPEIPGLHWAQGQPWCAVFVSWVAMKARAARLYPRTASCDVAADWFRHRNRTSEYPAIGAQILYGSPKDLVHTGLVWAFDRTFVYTIEGNTNDNGAREGDGVYLKKRVRRDPYVVMYGLPMFPEGIKSADPRFQHRR